VAVKAEEVLTLATMVVQAVGQLTQQDTVTQQVMEQDIEAVITRITKVVVAVVQDVKALTTMVLTNQDTVEEDYKTIFQVYLNGMLLEAVLQDTITLMQLPAVAETALAVTHQVDGV
jgi:hypothetical protein